MQCPKCDCELGDQAHCPKCDRKDEASAETTNTPESGDNQDVAADSNVPPLTQEDPSQTADSSTQQTESESPEENVPKPREPVPPTPNVETPVSGNLINSKGDLRILEQANQNIEKIYRTEVHDSEIHAGRDVTIAGITITTAGQTNKAEDERSLFSLTRRLPERPLRLHQSIRAEVNELVSQLRKTRILFVACPSRELAIDAGYAAVTGLGLANPDQNRVLIQDDALRVNLEFSIQKLLEKKPEEEGDTAVLVDAHGTSAETFANSILYFTAWEGIVREDLLSGHLFLVVIVSPEYAQKRQQALKRNSLFAYWEVPFLRPYLERHYPDRHEQLEAEILRQREHAENWKKDQTDFYQQIIYYHESGELLAVAADGGPKADPDLSAESLLKASNPVEKIVLYTAAFFYQITPIEFCRVVEALLAKRTLKNTLTTKGANGNDAPGLAQTEIPLNQIWEEEKDDIFTKLLRETSSGKDSVRVVGLSDPALRESLRRLFDRQHRYYLIDQFRALQERGIFFHPSIRLAENTTQIAVEMACLYSDEFNESWIVGLIKRLRQNFESNLSDAPDGEHAMFQFLQPGAWNLALVRVSDVFRRMLELSQLKGMVHGSLEQLIKSGYYEDTLLLIKQLQFTPEFDELYWFKQLLHRADKRTRYLTYYYLYSYLKRMGSGVYEGLKKIEVWLPPTERDPDAYQPFDFFVLRLLIQYCVETVERFNSKHHGDWPSHYPLFAIKDGETATERTSLLARWLLHPGIEVTLAELRMGGTQMTLIGALLAEWAFILLGPKAASSGDKLAPPAGNGVWPVNGPTEGSADVEYSGATLFNLLIRQFASRTDLSQRLELLKFWNMVDHDLLRYLASLPYASELRNQLGWKRNLVRQLITRFKSLAGASKTTPRPAKQRSTVDQFWLKPSSS
jgi:hypothetical protein